MRVIWKVLVAGLFATIATGAYGGNAPLIKDAEVRANTPNAVFGNRNALSVREAQLQQSLLQFDLSGFTGPVVSATLTLDVSSVFRAGTFEVRRLLSSWNEGSVNFNNRPAISSQVDASFTLVSADSGRTVSIDVTSLVQQLLADPANDNGMALVPDGPIFVVMASGERPNGPTLSVETEGPPPTDPLVIESAFVSSNQISINGQNFDNGAMPTVTLSGIGLLEVDSVSATNIMASFVGGEVQDGDYLLTVSTGSEAGQTGTFDLTIGAVGNQGPPGPQGPQGEVGPAGPAGPQGPQGEVGPAGADGAVGAQGPQGEVGPAGPAGADGAVGPQGPQGEVGLAGPAGADGADGAIGPQGPQGDIGPQGPQGDAGPMGLAGADGAAGPMGPPGLPGPAGIAGVDGAEGPQGLQGETGPAGPQGPQGPTGPGGGFNGYQLVQECQTGSAMAPNAVFGKITQCPSGKKILGGGGLGGSGTAAAGVVLRKSHPNGDFSWWGEWVNLSSETVTPNVFCVWAICANTQ